FVLSLIPHLPESTLFPYTTLFRSGRRRHTATSPSPFRSRGGSDSASISGAPLTARDTSASATTSPGSARAMILLAVLTGRQDHRSEEHTSELQSRRDLVCRLLLEK